MIVYMFVLFIIVLQRIYELFIAKQNEIWMRERGAEEFGEDHYKWIVLMHFCFFAALSIEVVLRGAELISWWPVVLSVFLTAQVARCWLIISLGRFWNTKIIVMPGEKKVNKGLYKWIRHPNYVVVAVEILTLPLLFQAYVTAILFTLLNSAILIFVRIPVEEKALKFLSEGDHT
ncbi:isoprenylcysteine carboxyl methyltransferase family protein [Evansella cellulosilytica]|uniref:Isoprenylcysteine carboxyl methyltransferase n=1 Tax=Evansella cellulosilytica (strain ATCC 21833 / DSM 2522 / FERM P-1141 / JCM 9156 / N-4) TaxID=649639 RepID=E6TVY0_EVAC2|nr:isoprenylcysteine carboxylmethyltransferase family protein [Evansella cellulosilytica]ADU28689.1 Isoprenylcysteine carboxyl methyltransferase [Evansella cellulosilytica DSM 2522]